MPVALESRRRGDALKDDAGRTVRAVLYDANGADRTIELDEGVVDDLDQHHLLWVDLDRGDDESLRRIAPWFGIARKTLERLASPPSRPQLEQFERYVHVNLRAVSPASDGFDAIETDCLISRNWIITIHHPSFDLVSAFNEPINAETKLGALDGASFLSNLLDVVLNGYFNVVEELEGEVDELDERLLQEDVDHDELLRALVRLRRRITMLRRTLGPHRDVLALVTQPEFKGVSESAMPERYAHLYDRLEKAIDAVDNAREMLVGSFEIFMSQTAQRTNEVMKVLTVVSVLLLPAGLIAAILGMSVNAPLYRNPNTFWVGIALMVVLGLLTLFIARRRRWL